MPIDIVIGLKTLTLKSVSTMHRPTHKRVFTEDELRFLQTRPTAELHSRINLGDNLIALLYRPEMINMDSKQADMLSSNLRYQQDAIREIIKLRLG